MKKPYLYIYHYHFLDSVINKGYCVSDSVGYALVKNYLQKHPQETAATLVATCAELFI